MGPKIELDWIVAFQGEGGLKHVMIWFSYLGWEVLGYVLPLVYFCLSRRTGARLYLLFSVGVLAIDILKLAFHLPRPYWVDPQIQPLSASGNYGMPSGHVLASTVVWGFLAGSLSKSWAWVIAILVILVVSVSRVYLGVHFISDVVAAWVIAAGLLWSFRWVEDRLAMVMHSSSAWQQGLAALWTAAIFLGLGLGVRMAVNGIADSPLWAMHAGNARDLRGLFRGVGAFFGVACGIIMARRWAAFEVRGPWWKQGLAAGYALSGAWLIQELARLIPSADTEGLQFFVGFLTGAFSNWWILFFAPWLLLKIGASYTPPRSFDARR